jgi:hypothetical protein
VADSPQSLMTRAAHCYLRAGWAGEAARCYREAGAHRRAAEAWESIGALADAAIDYAAAGRPVRAAWLLVHELGQAEAARDVLAAAPEDEPAPPVTSSAEAAGSSTNAEATELLGRIVLARCDVADGLDPAGPLAVVDDVMRYLEQSSQAWHVPELQPWTIAVAEAMARLDLVALIFAAAVRGGRFQAAERWNEWSQRVLGVPLQLPDPDNDPETHRARPA